MALRIAAAIKMRNFSTLLPENSGYNRVLKTMVAGIDLALFMKVRGSKLLFLSFNLLIASYTFDF